MSRACALSFLLVSALAIGTAQQPAPAALDADDLAIAALLQSVETAISTTSRERWLALLSSAADRDAAAEFFDAMVPRGVTRAVIRERDRQPLAGTLPGLGHQLLTEVLIETGSRARIATWRLDVRRPRESDEKQPWRLAGQEKLASVEGLHHLTLHPEKQFAARDLVVKSVDLELRLPAGDVFVAETAEGVTALVLLGEGAMVFAPKPLEERGQIRIYAGGETLETPFSAAFVRLNPFEFGQLSKGEMLTPVARDVRAFRRAQAVFDEEVGKSFSLDLNDLSRETWSLLPQAGDFLAEVRTRRFATLTYARAASEAEDITLFHRARRRNIAAYASEMKLSSRGRFFNEDDLVEYDVLDYQIDATLSPEREWLEGRAQIKLRVKSYVLAALTLKLADEFSISSVSSAELGRLLFLKVRNQNSFVINLPSPVPRDMELTLTVTYSGRAERQSIDQESIGVASGGQRSEDVPQVPPERNWLYSNRNHWYPQAQVTDYATATVRVTVPTEFAVVASGVAESGSPVAVAPERDGIARAMWVFTAAQPVRYLGVIVSRFTRVDASTVALDILPPPAMSPGPDGASARNRPRSSLPAVGTRNTTLLTVDANKRQEQRGRDLLPTAAEIARLYGALVGDVPYDSMAVAMVEDNLPGGHSPGYFVVLNNPLPVTPYIWRNDPAHFPNFPEFFVAHEIAHQWFGQAVGWKNYHEQWLSEGFAQYFAALFARERRGESAFRDVVRQFRRWAIDQSDQGPIYLGYRLGHIKGDSRVFRALVYNKAAGVLHMLRRLVGDEKFFRGVRRFYAENRFRKAGTEDLQRAFERETGQSFERFFQRWIYESGIPRVRYSTAVEGQEVVVRFEQVPAGPDGPLYDIPVTVTLQYNDRTAEEVIPVTEAIVERRLPLTGTPRAIEVNADGAAIAIFERR